MAPLNIRRAQRHEIFVPKGTVTVSDVYPKMKQFDLHTLLRLRADGSLGRMMQLQTEDADAAEKLVLQVRTPPRIVDGIGAVSSESPEIIGVSASYDEYNEPVPRIQDELIGSRDSRDESPKPPRKGVDSPDDEATLSRRRSVKEMVAFIHSQNPERARRASEVRDQLNPGAVALAGLSGHFDDEEEYVRDPEPIGLRVQSGQIKNEVVGRLTEKQQQQKQQSQLKNPLLDDESRQDSLESSVDASTLDDDAKLYQERLNNRQNNVLVKRDAASFRVKREGSRTAGSETRPVVTKAAAAARLHTLKVKNKEGNKATAPAIINPIYTYEQLRNRTIEELATNPYPEAVDVENREQYLKDDEFFQVFGLTKADFNGIAKWRKTEMKKKKNLY